MAVEEALTKRTREPKEETEKSTEVTVAMKGGEKEIGIEIDL